MRTIRTALAAALLVAVAVPAAASAGNQCKVWWPSGEPLPTVVC